MRRPPRTTVVGWGAHHAIAVGSRVSVLAARAGQLELRAVPMAGPTGRAVDGLPGVVCAATSRSVEEGDPVELLAAIGAPALRESQGDRAGKAARIVACALPPTAPDGVLPAVARRLGVALDTRSTIHRGGAAAFATALERGRSLLHDGAEEVIVGAIDSPRLPGRLSALAAAGLLHDDDAARGRVPAEAAAFLRLALRRDGIERPRLAAIELGGDPASPGGLGRLLRRAAGAIATAPIRLLVDVTSDPARTTAWLADRAELEIGGARELLERVEVWSDDAGDVGTVTGAWLSVVAFVTARTGAVEGGGALIGLDGEPAVAAIAWDLPRSGGDFSASRERPSTHPATRERSRAIDHAWAADHRDRLTRSLLEDVGSLGLLLAPGDAGPDRGASAARLLRALDAVAAIATPGCGAPRHPDLLGAVRAYGEEVTPQDRARRFAQRFIEAHLLAPRCRPPRRSGMRRG